MLQSTRGFAISTASENRGTQTVKGWPTHVPTHFDGLTVLKLLNEDSLVATFLAKESAQERLIALSVLNANRAADAHLRDRFHTRALAAVPLTHSNVAATYRVGERADGLPYVAQEYVAGESLAELKNRLAMPPLNESLRIIAGLASALDAAHTLGIVHGDLRAQDVIIERDTGRIVVTGFGRISAQHAPHAGRSDDILRLGRIGHELLAVGKPFEGASAKPHSVLDLRSIRDDLPEALAQLLGACVDPDARGRPAAKELLSHLPREAVAASQQGPKTLTQRAVESSLMRTAVIAGLLIMAIGAAVGLWVYFHYSEAMAGG